MTDQSSRPGTPPPGFRLPPDTRLGSVTLQVADLERSLRFYQEVLGLHLLARETDGALLGAEDRHPIVALRERAGAVPVPRRGRLGLYHFAILLPDRPALGRFLGHLLELGVRPGMSDHLVSEAIYLSDPDGLGIEVYADRPRDTWRVAAGQLVMATEPLDAAAVLEAAAGAPWRGMPAGTVLGHVHLSVADLGEASRFYHDGLGMDRMVWGYPGALFLAAGGYHHHLGTNTWAGGAPPAGPDDARLLEWEVVVPTDGEARQALDSLEAAGATVRREAAGGASPDPWGTVVRIRAGGSGAG